MAGCKSTCLHRALVLEYRLWRLAWEQAAEEASIGYQTEYDEYAALNPPPTFKQWLIGHQREEAAA